MEGLIRLIEFLLILGLAIYTWRLIHRAMAHLSAIEKHLYEIDRRDKLRGLLEGIEEQRPNIAPPPANVKDEQLQALIDARTVRELRAPAMVIPSVLNGKS